MKQANDVDFAERRRTANDAKKRLLEKVDRLIRLQDGQIAEETRRAP